MMGIKKTAINYIILAIVIFCSIGYGIGLVGKSGPVTPVPIVQTFQETIQGVLPACVFIDVVSVYGYSWSGSGVIISPDGKILTAGHVVEGAESITVELNDGRVFGVSSFSALPNNDGGYLQIDPNEPLPYVDCGDPKMLTVGDGVFIIGCPYGIGQRDTVTKGIVSHLCRDIPFFGEELMIQVDAASWPGNSGGPVFNMDGEVIAILVGGMGNGDSLSFCTPIDIFFNRMIDVIAEKCSDWMESVEI